MNYSTRSPGVRKRMDATASERPGFEDFIEQEWEQNFRRWFKRVGLGMQGFLQEQLRDVLDVLSYGLPPDTGLPRQIIHLDQGEEWLRKVVEELEALQSVLGVKRDVTAAAPPPARFAELRASGLVSEKMINDLAKEMVAPRTPRQLYRAIGAAKELTEATLRAALDQLGVGFQPTDDLPRLMRRWREAIGAVAPPDPTGATLLDKAQAAVANLVVFMAEWRNAYGTGHGRPQYPRGLKQRHARLTADAAEMCIRFIVTTMDDLELLPSR